MATKKATKTAKPAALKITPIDPVSEPKRKRKSTAAPAPVPTAKIEDPLGEPADGEGKTYLGDKSALEAGSEASSATPALSNVDEVHPERVANVDAPSEVERPFSEAWVAEDSATTEEAAVNEAEPEELEDEPETAAAPRPPAKLERLQKIFRRPV